MTRWHGGRYRAIFAIPAFRAFWLGLTASELGDAMTRVALFWFVFETTHSAHALGGLMVAYTGPIIGGGFLAGWLLDRFERRRVMLVDSAVRGCAVAIIPLLHALGRLALWHVYVVAAIYGLLMMISLAGSPSIVPSLVPTAHLPTANALEMLSFTLSGVIGPPLAGYAIGWFGAPNVLVLDALSYAAFAGALAGMRVPAPEAGRQQHGQPAFRLHDAVRLLLREPVLLATTLMFMAYNVGNGALAVWLPVFAQRTLGGGASLYGALLGVIAVGQMASALSTGSLRLPLPLGTLICLAQGGTGIALAIVLAGRNLACAVVGLLLYGLCSAPLTIWAQTLRMRIIPERLRGRTFALLRMLMQGTNPIGGAAAGALVPLLGVPAIIGISALFAGVPGALGSRVRPFRTAGGVDEIAPAPRAIEPVGEEEARAV